MNVHNRYSYCLNSPLKFTDPSGYCLSKLEKLGKREYEGVFLDNMLNDRMEWLNSGGGSYKYDFMGPNYTNWVGGGTAEGFTTSDPAIEEQLEEALAALVGPVETQNPEEGASAQGDGVGQPGTWEGLIPIWGSGRAAVDHFQNGNYWRGIGYSALAISDVFLVKSIATAVGRGAWKVGAHSWSATRQWLGKSGYAETGQPVHHWAISQATAKQYGIEAFTNQPWNLMTFSNQSLHMRAGHGMMYMREPGYGVMGQLWFGTPIWPKAVFGSYGGRFGLDY